MVSGAAPATGCVPWGSLCTLLRSQGGLGPAHGSDTPTLDFPACPGHCPASLSPGFLWSQSWLPMSTRRGPRKEVTADEHGAPFPLLCQGVALLKQVSAAPQILQMCS